MIATIRDDQFIWFDQISPHEENILWEHLSVSRPGAMRYIDTSVMSNWDGVYRFYNRAKHRCVRPLLATVRRICEENNLLLKVRDEREPTEFKPPDPDTLDPSNLLPGVVMDPWQMKAVRAACSSECGIVDIPTGGGKCLGRNTPVLMYDFTVKMVQDVVVGDRIMGDDGTPRTVLSVCSGVDDLYEVRQKNGDNYVVNSCHIMSLIEPDGKLIDIDVQDYLKLDGTHKRRLFGYKRPINKANRLVQDPLVCGVEVVNVGTGEYFGFQIDGNRRFMLGDFTVTHNTECIAGICTVIRCPTIILADQTIVVEQIRDRLALRKVNEEIGMFFAGIRPGGDELIVVGSIQSLQLPPKIPDLPKRSDKDTDATWKRKLAKYDQRMTGYKTRLKNAKWLRSIAKQAHMVIVDECVHEDSWVNTDSGLLRAKDVESAILSGIEVSAVVGGMPHRISGVTRSHKDAFLLKTSSNRELVASGNHRMSVLCGSVIRDVYLSDLVPGDLLLTPRSKPSPGYSLEWYHAGLFIGDGHFMRKHRHRVRFAVRKDLDDWRVAASGIVALWGGELKEKVNKRGDLVLVVDSQAFCEWLRSLGFRPGRKMGRMHIDFAIPSHSAAIGLLRGLFDAEGTGYTQTGRFAVTDEVLSRLVQQLLSYIGIGSSISFGARKNPKHLPLWRVNLSGENYSSFLETVGFGFSRKVRSYSNSLSSDRLIDPSPYFRNWMSCGLTPSRLKKWVGIRCSIARPPKVSLQQLVEFHKSVTARANSDVATYADAREWYDVSDSKIARKFGISTMTSWNHRSSGDNSKWVAYVDEIRQKLLSCTSIDPLLANYGVECVESITACGAQPLIDFAVESAHRFEANGLLVHNCDRAASSYYKDFFRNVFRGRRRYGFSGTPFEPTKPVECMTIRSHLGDIIAKETRSTLEKNRRIIPIEYFGLVMEGDPKESSAYDIAYKEHITDSPKFWKLVVSLCKKYNHEGTLILVDKEALGENLKRELAAAGIEAPFIYGKTPKKKRNEILRAYEARKFKVLIGGKIINRGLDLKGGCENLIIATGGKLWSDFNQKIGRAVRHNSAGKGRVFDFFFRCNKYLYNHSKERLRSVVGMGYKATIVFPGLRVDGSELVKSGFRVTKKMRGVK